MFKKEKRPWGEFKIIHKEPGITIKIITVKPYQRLSLQSHKLRDEMWLLLQGSALCEIDYYSDRMKKGVAYIIPKKARHRLTGGKKGCKILEVSFGEFDEKDIVRYQDDYGRIKSQ